MNVRERIYQRIRNDGVRCNGVWKFQQYNALWNELSCADRKEFEEILHEMVTKEFFIQEPDGGTVYRYRLTPSGEAEVWKEF